MAFSIPELQALVIATQPRELQLVNLNNLLDLLDARLDVQHDMFVKSITSLMVLFLKSSIAFCKALMTSSSSGDFPLSFLTSETFYVTESFFQPAVPPFSARTNLSPLSPTRTFNMSFSTSTTRTGFSEASFSVARTIKPQPRLLLALLFLSWVLRSHPWQFFSHPFGTCFIKRSVTLRLGGQHVFHRRCW